MSFSFFKNSSSFRPVLCLQNQRRTADEYVRARSRQSLNSGKASFFFFVYKPNLHHFVVPDDFYSTFSVSPGTILNSNDVAENTLSRKPGDRVSFVHYLTNSHTWKKRKLSEELSNFSFSGKQTGETSMNSHRMFAFSYVPMRLRRQIAILKFTKRSRTHGNILQRHPNCPSMLDFQNRLFVSSQYRGCSAKVKKNITFSV